MTPELMTQSLKREAKKLGFDVCGTCPAVSPPGFQHLQTWLEEGFHGQMNYLVDRVDAYRHPGHVLDGAVGILMLGLNYKSTEPAPLQSGQGRISRYAWSDCDYHDVIHAKLKNLVNFCRSEFQGVSVRGVVDTAPLLEREFAQLAGIGWQAKNTMLISREIGSWFFLAALLVDQPLSYDEPFSSTGHCGTCTACIDACPTDAFVGPHRLDATRCISYLTIEHKTAIPVPLREGIGNWVFGCDVCQDVCPWNRKTSPDSSGQFNPAKNRNPLELFKLFDLTDESFRRMFRKTPLWRPRRRGLLRNAAIVLGNQPHDENISVLEKGLNDEEVLVRGASAWALGRHSYHLAAPRLQERLQIEQDQSAIDEIESALGNLAAEAD